ncbi:PulJ/GspJ family protein [Nocardioides sp. GXZ039]|uniref:PulJ/GspJ family protein n=1 Tax=Nocardioides sp. GXZ039 TaxID=3136018 RepID=UPI0030F43146
MRTTEPTVAEGGAAPAERPRDAGMSLAELMVALGIFTLILVVVGSTAVAAIRTVGGMENRVDNAAQAELGLSSMSKVLRTAVLPQQLDAGSCPTCADVAVTLATATQVTFHANLGRSSIGPSLVTLSVLQDPAKPGTAILEQRTIDPTPGASGSYTFCTPGSGGCRVERRVLARSLVWPTAAVFSYYDTDGVLMTGSSLSAVQKAKISSVDVVLTAQTRPGQDRWPPFTAVQRIRLPNVEISSTITE